MAGKKKLRLSKRKMVFGVCGGIAEYVDVDPGIVRILWVLFTFLTVGAGILGYLAAWLIMREGEAA